MNETSCQISFSVSSPCHAGMPVYRMPFAIAKKICPSANFCVSGCDMSGTGGNMLRPNALFPVPASPWHMAQLSWNVRPPAFHPSA
jgi:hypothetical protein